MMEKSERFSGRAEAALAAAVWLIVTPASAAASPSGDAHAEEAAIGEVLAFYRDLSASNWSALVDHFWPAKVVARSNVPQWLEHPDPEGSHVRGRRLWTAADVPVHDRRIEALAVRVDGPWARVEVAWRPALREATPRTDVLWLFALESRWKIVRVVGPTSETTGP